MELESILDQFSIGCPRLLLHLLYLSRHDVVAGHTFCLSCSASPACLGRQDPWQRRQMLRRVFSARRVSTGRAPSLAARMPLHPYLSEQVSLVEQSRLGATPHVAPL